MIYKYNTLSFGYAFSLFINIKNCDANNKPAIEIFSVLAIIDRIDAVDGEGNTAIVQILS